MAAERQRGAFDAAGQPPPLQVMMEPAQTVDVDSAVVHPDTLNHVGDCGRPLDAKEGLVDQIEYVAHFPMSISYRLPTLSGHTVRSNRVGLQSDPPSPRWSRRRA